MLLGGQSKIKSLRFSAIRGVSIEVGHGRTSIVPVYGGYPLSHAAHSIVNGGTDSTEFMLPVLKELVESIGLILEDIGMEKNSLIAEIKQKLAFVPLDYEIEVDDEEENPDLEQTSYVLPDGEHIITVPLHVRC